MNISPRRLTEIPRAEALSLLAGAAFGRIIFTDHAMPAVRLVSHLVDEPDIVIRNHYGVAITRGEPDGHEGSGEEGRNGIVVAYAADEIDSVDGPRWSVVVTGTATVVRGPRDIARYERDLPAWSKDDASARQFLRIRPGIVTGYRLAGEAA